MATKITIDWEALRAPFPPEAISWRVGATTKDRTKGLALAYLTARSVMDRLDEVCGQANWQCRYPIASDKTCCEIGIKVESEWVWKSDGAGDTDFEGAKGAFSDALKRAAVRWGIGRYLYDLDSPWVAIEQKGNSYTIRESEQQRLNTLLANGTADAALGSSKGKVALKNDLRTFIRALDAVKTADDFAALMTEYQEILTQCETDEPDWWFGMESNPDFLPLQDRITNKRQELAGELSAEHMV